METFKQNEFKVISKWFAVKLFIELILLWITSINKK